MLNVIHKFFSSSNMFFDFGRSEGFPTQYAPFATPVTVDVLEAGLITAFLILAVCFLISLPSGKLHKNISGYTRVLISLLIGLLLLLGNFGQEWEVAHIRTKTAYKAGIADQINASVGFKIGLRSVNVTLKSIPQPGTKLEKEIINYNERFEWTWDQGRFGFGPYAGHLQQEFRAAQYRGIPLPILWVVDYFVIDGEGFRFGRFFRLAGWYCHIILWLAFAFWILANILLRSVIKYGGYCLGITGVLQLTANLVWFVVRNPIALVVPFEDANMKPKFGISFWLTFASGVLCIVICIIITIMDYFFERQLHTFFDVDPLTSYEVAYITKDEEKLLRRKTKHNLDIPLMPMNEPDDEDDHDYMPVLIKRSTYLGSKGIISSKSLGIRSPPEIPLTAVINSPSVNREYKPVIDRTKKPNI